MRVPDQLTVVMHTGLQLAQHHFPNGFLATGLFLHSTYTASWSWRLCKTITLSTPQTVLRQFHDLTFFLLWKVTFFETDLETIVLKRSLRLFPLDSWQQLFHWTSALLKIGSNGRTNNELNCVFSLPWKGSNAFRKSAYIYEQETRAAKGVVTVASSRSQAGLLRPVLAIATLSDQLLLSRASTPPAQASPLTLKIPDLCKEGCRPALGNPWLLLRGKLTQRLNLERLRIVPFSINNTVFVC